MRLRQTHSLSASAKPFVPLTASSATATRPAQGGNFPPMGQSMEPIWPLYTTDNEGTTTDCSSVSKLPQRQGSHSSKRHKKSAQSDTRVSNSGSESSSSLASASDRGTRKKKTGVNAKVTIPEFGGKTSHSHDVVGAF